MFVCFRARVQATPASLFVHESDPAELPEPGGLQEVEEETVELESPQSAEGVFYGTHTKAKEVVLQYRIIFVVNQSLN